MGFLTPGPTRGPATDWENLLPDYSNIRGLNYLSTYPDLFDNPPDLPPHLVFRGVSSTVAMWRFWDSRTVDIQLGYVKRLGGNSVRVFLSHAVWEHEERNRGLGPNRFIERWLELVALCEKHRLYLMPVLFDELGLTGPVPYDDIDRWVRNPPLEYTNVAWATDPTNPFNGDRYVRAVVEATRESPALFMWDVMNEPGPRFDWLAHWLDRIREWDPDPAHPITIGFAAHIEGAPNPLLRHPNLDVISFHPYGMFRQNVEEWTRTARLAAMPPLSDRPKPVLATEGGSPGELARYDKTFEYARELHFGIMPWAAMIGDPRDNMPFKADSGFFFHDGEARNGADTRAFQRWGGTAVVPGLLPGIAEKRDLTGFTPPRFPNGFGVEEMTRELHPLRWPHRPKLSDENVATDGYLYQFSQLRLVGKDLGWLSDVDQYRGLLRPQDQEAMLAFDREWARHALIGGPEPWLIGSPPVAVDWERYDRFFTDWGLVFWTTITANGLGG